MHLFEQLPLHKGERRFREREWLSNGDPNVYERGMWTLKTGIFQEQMLSMARNRLKLSLKRGIKDWKRKMERIMKML